MPERFRIRRRRRERERARDKRRERTAAAARRLAGVVRGVLVAAALLLSFLPVPFTSSPIAYVPFITVVLFLVVDRVYLSMLKRSLSFDEEAMRPTCERGELVEFSVAFSNSSLLAYPRIEVVFYIGDLFGGYAHEMQTSTSLLPHEKAELRFEARFAHLGTYAAGVKQIEVHDLLGLWSVVLENTRQHSVRVQPKLFDPGKVELSNVSLKESNSVFRPIITDDMDYAGVRDYRYGDPLKAVHWKLSSRYPDAEMYTRLFEVYGNPGVETIIDPWAPEYDDEDLMHVFDGLVEGAFSVNEYARSAGMDTKVAFIGADGEKASTQVAGMASIEDAVGRMATVSRAEASPDSGAAVRLLRGEAAGNQGMGNLVFVTSRLEDDALSALVDMKMRRRNPLLVLVVPRSVEGRERVEFLLPLRRLDAAGIGYYILESTDETTEVVAA